MIFSCVGVGGPARLPVAAAGQIQTKHNLGTRKPKLFWESGKVLQSIGGHGLKMGVVAKSFAKEAIESWLHPWGLVVLYWVLNFYGN